jgi:hypothetical protein
LETGTHSLSKNRDRALNQPGWIIISFSGISGFLKHLRILNRFGIASGSAIGSIVLPDTVTLSLTFSCLESHEEATHEESHRLFVELRTLWLIVGNPLMNYF